MVFQKHLRGECYILFVVTKNGSKCRWNSETNLHLSYLYNRPLRSQSSSVIIVYNNNYHRYIIGMVCKIWVEYIRQFFPFFFISYLHSSMAYWMDGQPLSLEDSKNLRASIITTTIILIIYMYIVCWRWLLDWWFFLQHNRSWHPFWSSSPHKREKKSINKIGFYYY